MIPLFHQKTSDRITDELFLSASIYKTVLRQSLRTLIENNIDFTVADVVYLRYPFGSPVHNAGFYNTQTNGRMHRRTTCLSVVELFVCCLAHRGSTIGFLLLQCSSGVVRHPGDLRVSVAIRFCRVLIFASS